MHLYWIDEFNRSAPAKFRLSPPLIIFLPFHRSAFCLIPNLYTIHPPGISQYSPELLGRGNFGSSYVVRMDDGKRFVVKRLIKSVGISELDFKRNMEIVGDVRHCNVVALRAYYSSTDEKLMLYDYYSSGSMYSLLYGENRADVDWETRLKIAIGAARGIAEIHTQLGGMLVHGNIKSSNIFLDIQSYGCVSDFGLTNTTETTFTPSAKWYAPKVKNTENVSHTSDVYSFGILLLELLTRKSGGPAAVDLVKLVNSVKSKERAAKVFDPDLLKHPSISKQMIKMLEIGIRCVADSAKERPKIFEVVKMLEDIVILNPVSHCLASMSQERKLVFLEDVYPIFELEYLLTASADMLGKGTTGTSYKATLDNGNVVVVKRLRDVTATFREFQHHMEVFGRMNHTNIGRLNAYYYSRDEKLLVYDYYARGSLSALLHGTEGVSRTSLDWATRVKIALGVARGIAYIHSKEGWELVLGNIKSLNIFPDGQNNFIGFDAGLTNLVNPARLSGILSPGYCAPEVANSGKVSQASDVYSFGVVLLELVSGRASQQLADYGYSTSLAEWIQSVDSSEWTAEVLDVECLRDGNEQAMIQLLQITMGCVSTVPEHRPTIFEVVKVLEEMSGEVEPQIVLEKSYVESSLEYLLEGLLPMLSP
ncbi:Leucine-rich repeat protein kinase family protein [Perilla frutescens var. hirtella]|nr:Leucine-rich repeat protein kinase family protein [Perilla frutescens var. hirtella]